MTVKFSIINIDLLVLVFLCAAKHTSVQGLHSPGPSCLVRRRRCQHAPAAVTV